MVTMFVNRSGRNQQSL